MQNIDILVVDDSQAARHLYVQCLKPLNANIITANNGKEGLQTALSSHLDIVVTDVDMPEMDGITFCQSLKRYPQTRELPVIIASTFDSENDIEKGFTAGAAAYLSKSEVRSHIKETVEKVLWKTSHLRQRKILVVDDSRSIRHIVEQGLKASGFNVVTASNGNAAMAVMREEKPGLILSDINMPEMNGFELCKAVKGDPNYSAIPFVAMSDNKNKSHMNRMIHYGASDYIAKPFNIDHLVLLIERNLSDYFTLVSKERERLEWERTLLLDSISSLVSALEARDAYTKGHSIAVSRIASEMLRLTGADEEAVATLKIAGRLHDIGKIGVMDSVLLKPGKLSDDEFDHIKQHPEIGKKILQAIPSLAHILPVVHCHHERWDGTGYPQGLAGESIPFWARLTAVADTFHALTSDRPYRKGMPFEKAFNIIREVRGTQLCPRSIDIFFDWIRAKGNTDRLY